MMLRVRMVPLALLFACGQGTDGSVPDTGLPPVDCPTHDGATFELGTGQSEFIPIADEAPLSITRGPQGGCHFFISVRTDGFAERRFVIQYEVLFAETGTTTGSRSSFTVRLRPVDDQPGRCQFLGSTAFLIQPWRFVDDRVILEVNVTDDEGRTDSKRKTVIARWPSGLPDDACGPRS